MHKKIHTGEKPYSCKKCDYKCTQKYLLDGHINKEHGESSVEKPIKLENEKWKCPCCEYTNKRKSAVTKHIKSVHLGNRGIHS